MAALEPVVVVVIVMGHVDRCHGWDVWGHEAVVDKVGRWQVIGGHGGGVTAAYGIESGVDVHEWGWGGKRGSFWIQADTRGCRWWQVSEGGVN